jgi:hypothetical protein
MKRGVYERVLAINAGFDQVRRAFQELRKCPGFQPSEVDRFRQETEEIRASAMSYIAEVIQTEEADAAGRRFRKRMARQRREQ